MSRKGKKGKKKLYRKEAQEGKKKEEQNLIKPHGDKEGKKNSTPRILEEEEENVGEDRNVTKKTLEDDENNLDRTDSEGEEGENLSSTISDENLRETTRRMRENHLNRYKMVRTRKGLKYEEDIPIQEKQPLKRNDDRYSSRHTGIKVVEASLIPSAKVGSFEANKAKILRYAHGKGYKISEVKDRGFAKVDLIFDNYIEANRCLDDKTDVNGGKEVMFEIPSRAKICRGVITGWDLQAPLDELIDSMEITSNIVAVERLKRRVYDKDTKTVRETISHVICMTWEGNCVPTEIRIYGGLTRLKVRPFVDNVLQCFRCYKFGHLMKHCRTRPMCIACGECFHGHCDREYRCVNCNGRHKATSKRCPVYEYNTELKKIMASNNVSINEAKEILLRRQNGLSKDGGGGRRSDRNNRILVGRLTESGFEYDKENNFPGLGYIQETEYQNNIRGKNTYTDAVMNRQRKIERSYVQSEKDRFRDQLLTEEEDLERDSIFEETEIFNRKAEKRKAREIRREKLIEAIVDRVKTDVRELILQIAREEIKQTIKEAVREMIGQGTGEKKSGISEELIDLLSGNKEVKEGGFVIENNNGA